MDATIRRLTDASVFKEIENGFVRVVISRPPVPNCEVFQVEFKCNSPFNWSSEKIF